MQTLLDFSNITTQSQNNRESEMILEANLPKLNGQCKTVYDLLIEGKSITVKEALLMYGIGDLRARIYSLRRAGIMVKDQINAGGFKTYYL